VRSAPGVYLWVPRGESTREFPVQEFFQVREIISRSCWGKKKLSKKKQPKAEKDMNGEGKVRQTPALHQGKFNLLNPNFGRGKKYVEEEGETGGVER